MTIDVVGMKNKIAAPAFEVNDGALASKNDFLTVKLPATGKEEFHVKACTDKECLTDCSAEVVTTTSEATVSGLENGRSYYACVSQVDSKSGKFSAWQSSEQNVAIDWTPPTNPGNIRAESALDGQGRLPVAFDPSEDSTAVTYNIKTCRSNSCSLDCLPPTSASGLEVSLGSVQAQQINFICVQGQDLAGNTSAWVASDPLFAASSGQILNLSKVPYPLYTGNPASICNNQQFYSTAGELVSGTKNCDLAGLAPDNIKAGVSIAGVVGTLTGVPTCSGEGRGSCFVNYTNYVVAAKANLLPGYIRKDHVIGGVTGTYPSIATPLAAATALPDLASLGPATPVGNYEFFDSAGNRYTGTVADGGTITAGTSAQTISAANTVYRQFTVAGDSALAPASIESGVSIFGVAGVAVSPPAACTGANQTGCLTTTTYRTMNVSAAGSGTGLTAANFNGSITTSAAFEFWDAAGARHSMSGDANLSASNIRNAVSIFGVTGTVTPTPADCGSDGDSACVIDGSTYVAAHTAPLVAGNIKNGVTIGGVTGSYPSAGTPLAGATATNDLTSFGPATAVGSYEFFDSTGSRYTGAIADGGTITATTSDQTISAANTVYRQFTVAGDADLAPANIASGVNLFGVTGSTALSPGDCTSDGQSLCVAEGTNYIAALKSQVVAGNIKNGVTLGGVAGNYPSAGSPLTGATATSDLTSFGPATTVGSYEFFDSAGARYTGAVADGGTVTAGTSNQSLSTAGTVYRQAVVQGDSDLVAANIASGVSIFGVTGSATLSPGACSAGNQSGCVATSTYKTIDLTNAGQGGAGTLTSANFNASLVTNSSFEYWDAAGARHTFTGDSNLAATNIKTAVSLFGVTGSLIPHPGNCSSDGASGCVVDGTSYVAGTKSQVTAGNIKNGVSLGAISGTYPSAGTPLAANTATTDLTSLGPATATGSYEFFDSAGVRYTGAIADGGTITPTTSDQTTSTAGTVYRQFIVAGDSDLTATNVKTGITLFGVSGSLVQSPATCTSNQETGCVTTATYKSTDWTNLVAGNIKNGVSVAGVAGAYPSSTYTLPGASGTADLDNATFDAKIKSAASFEYWGPDGTRYTQTGDSNLDPVNTLNAVTIFGVTGDLYTGSNCSADAQTSCIVASPYKSYNSASFNVWDILRGGTVAGVAGEIRKRCNNRVDSSLYNQDSSGTYVNTAVTSGTANDWWDTIDNYRNGVTAIPQVSIDGWGSDATCDTTEGLWQDITADGTCNSNADDCIFLDRASKLSWSESYPATGSAPAMTTLTWADAVQRCDALVYGGYSDWRLPTQMELMQAYIYGIRDLAYKSGTSGSTSNNSYFTANIDSACVWSAATYHIDTTKAAYIESSGKALFTSKSGTTCSVMCVR